MKKIFLPMFVILMTVISIFPTTKVSAREYRSTLYLNENSVMLGDNRFYDSGTFYVSVEIDRHLGSNPNAKKKLWNVLVYYPSSRQVAGVMTGSELNTCTYASFGSFTSGRYQFGFATKDASGTVYKGVQSNSVVMGSRK